MPKECTGPGSSPMPLKEILFKEMQQELTTIMRDEWLREVELSSEVIRINTPSLTITCLMREAMVQTLFNDPTSSANIILASFSGTVCTHRPKDKALHHTLYRFWDELLAPTDKTF